MDGKDRWKEEEEDSSYTCVFRPMGLFLAAGGLIFPLYQTTRRGDHGMGSLFEVIALAASFS